MKRHYLLGLLLLSGFAGLAYELLWVRMLAWSMGSTTMSFSTVLAVFFAGLALGSRWGGRRVPKTARPVRQYALLELGTAAFGLISYPVMSRLGAVFAWLDPGVGPGAVALRLAVATLVLLPPTFLMGATLPFVSLAMIEDDSRVGQGTSLIYGLNTLGACLGAYGVTFVLLPQLGVFGSTLLVVGLNVVVGVVALLVSARPGGDGPWGPSATAPDTGVATAGRRGLAVMGLALVAGFVAVGVQVVWGRLFGIVLRGTVYGIGSVLISVLVGIALGSLLAANLARSRRLGLVIGVTGLVYLVGLVVFVLATPLAQYVVSTVPNSNWPTMGQVHAELLVVFLVLVVPTVASGALLPLLVALIEHSARNAGVTLSRLYATNTVGSIVGSVLIGYLALPRLGSASTLLGLVVLFVLALAVFLVAVAESQRAALALVAVGLGVVAVFPELDTRLVSRIALSAQAEYFTARRSQQQAAERIRFFSEGDVATVAVAETPSSPPGLSLTLNGLGQGSRTPALPHVPYESTLVALMPWLHATTPDRGLVIGLGAGATVDALARLEIPDVQVLELERDVVEAVNVIWGDENPLRRPGISHVVNDARQFLLIQQRRQPRSYDFITSMPAHPWVAPALFTRDFFELAAANLKEGGVFSTWFGTTTVNPRAVESLLGAFTEVFTHWLVYWVPETNSFYLLGSQSPFMLDAERLASLEGHPVMVGLPAGLRSPWHLPTKVVAGSAEGVPAPTGLLVNTDDNAIVEFFSTRKPADAPRASFELLSFLPGRFLHPSRVRAPDRDAFMLEWMEQLLETPGGRLPVKREVSPPTREMLTGVAPHLSLRLRQYAEFRLALGAGKREAAQAALVALGDDALAARGRRLFAGAEPTDGARRRALRELRPRTADVAALLVALGDQPDEVLAEPDEPLSWLFSDAEVPAAERGPLEARLTARLARFANARLYERCRATAQARQWPVLEKECEVAVVAARRVDAQRTSRRGVSLAEKGQHREALDHLWGAHLASPLGDEQLLLAWGLALTVGDEKKAEQARETFLMRGRSPETVAAMEPQARWAVASLSAGRPVAPDEGPK